MEKRKTYQEVKLPRVRTARCEVFIPVGFLCLWCGFYHTAGDYEPEQLDLVETIEKLSD